MFGDRFYGPAYFGNHYFGPAAAGGEEPPPTPDDSFSPTFSLGMGPMGKTRVHPHPLFSRVKQ